MLQAQTKTSVNAKSYRPEWIFAVQLHNGIICVGHSNNPSRKIAMLNSGMLPAVKQSLMVNTILGIKEQNEERTLIGTYNKFKEAVGEDRVIVV